jgi:hypothetical protein
MATADQGYLVNTIGSAAAGADILKLRWFPNNTPLEGTLLVSGNADGVLDIEVSPPACRIAMWLPAQSPLLPA